MCVRGWWGVRWGKGWWGAGYGFPIKAKGPGRNQKTFELTSTALVHVLQNINYFIVISNYLKSFELTNGFVSNRVASAVVVSFAKGGSWEEHHRQEDEQNTCWEEHHRQEDEQHA